MDAPAAGGYIDFSRFANLRNASRADEAAALETVADEFEALFVDLMLKAARQASPGDGLFDSQAGDTYREMFDQQMALSMARDHDFGIGAALKRQLEAHLGQGIDENAPASGAGNANPSHGLREVVPRAAAPGSHPVGQAEVRAARFVERTAPHALEAARRLGVSPRAIVAQAALETGWGRHVIRDAAGESSHNYFGIKADSSWTGDTVTVPTTEYVNGRQVAVTARFRAYPSVSAAFDDYVDFIRSNPRYREALGAGREPSRFASQLAAAGYATDPRYAEKIMSIVDKADWSAMHVASQNAEPGES